MISSEKIHISRTIKRRISLWSAPRPSLSIVYDAAIGWWQHGCCEHQLNSTSGTQELLIHSWNLTRTNRIRLPSILNSDDGDDANHRTDATNLQSYAFKMHSSIPCCTITAGACSSLFQCSSCHKGWTLDFHGRKLPGLCCYGGVFNCYCNISAHILTICWLGARVDIIYSIKRRMNINSFT